MCVILAVLAAGLHGAVFRSFLRGLGRMEQGPTTGVLVFAGMNGNSLPSEVLFNHVPFFSGGGRLAEMGPNSKGNPIAKFNAAESV